MLEKQGKWTAPDFEILEFGREDVIRTSGSVVIEQSGSGDTVNWHDLFK